MSDVIINQMPLAIRYVDNPYFPENKWLRERQERQLAAIMQRGIPTRKEELWKYTDVTRLGKQEFHWARNDSAPSTNSIANIKKTNLLNCRLVFVNGYFSASLSHITTMPKGVVLCPLSQAFTTQENEIKTALTEFDAQQYPFASLNTALMTDGVFLKIPKDTVVPEPIHCLFINTQQDDVITCPRNIIIAGASSQVTLIEEYVGEQAENYFTNFVTTINSEQNSQIQHYKIQDEHTQATHIANTFVMQNQDSVFKSFNLGIGSRLAREDLRIALQERGAECHLNGFYHVTRDGQSIDNHLHVDHIAAHGNSSMFYKGILDNRSQAVFNGKVYVHKDAQKINAQQANHNLLLSKTAEVNTKPELEIYADDVKCTHGATVGQLDNESLFYLRARGIEKQEAMSLLTGAFAIEVLSKIENHPIRQYMQQRAGQYDQ